MEVSSYLLVFAAVFEICIASRIHASCPPIKLKFGRARKAQRGRFVTFFCNTGYTLAGERHAACVQGRWDAILPKCVRPTCPMRTAPSNGLIFPSHGGGVLNIYCKPSYQARGSTITYCDGRRWDTALPSCLKVNTTPPLSCDFESEDICGWNHDVNHDFDWKRLNFNTPTGTIGTGPSHDHTKGERSDGYYMYIESSYRSENDTARLISPIYDKTTTNTCFEFFYHMYGATIGTLRVYRKTINQEWYFNPESAIFSKSGNQGDRWYRGFLDLGVMTEDYQIIIEGVRGASYVSDIAIDDVRIVENCVYEDETATTTDSSQSTEEPVSVESCQNRCDNSSQINDNFVITCDCDDTCYDKNRCCPDYFQYCVQGSTSDDVVDETSPSDTTVTDIETTMKLKASTAAPSTTSRSSIATTSKPGESFTAGKSPTTIPAKLTFPTVKTTTLPPPKKVTLPPRAKITLPPGAKVTLPPRAKVTLPPGAKVTLPPGAKVTLPPREKVEKLTLPPLEKPAKITLSPYRQPVLLSPPPTVVVVKKTKPPPKKGTDSKITYVRPEKDRNDLSNDIIEIFATTIFEVITPGGPIKETEPLLRYSADPNRQKIVIEQHHKDYTRTVIFAIGVVSAVVLALVAMAFVVRRYRLYNWRSVRGLRSSSHGESQSDLSFLASCRLDDETIDFTLPRNYDSL